ncbi:DUF3086 domain-containing protein [Phormidium sp. LEGE 05292]|uniref:DUF3086 domain-containing protein n=1 Tax=[Phormidium] sp. LEGE 05292 TaxID=767427 RepID=UPI00188245BB|nr:DUF3086 domain-containing protein [Phormidium sp. LEGE 05292]MBE9229176.1 DUF3086 domain-containing protein [Phormidium sp. LEGE 05292]
MNSDSSPLQKSDSEPKVDPWADPEPENATVEQIPIALETQTSDFNSVPVLTNSSPENEVTTWEQRVADLQQQERILKQQIASLQGDYTQQIAEMQTAMSRVVQESLRDLEQRRQTLQLAVEQLERRQERIRNEMKTTFAGVSQDLAIRVQGFKDYLVGSLQDLATAAEQLDLVPQSEESEMVEVKEAKPAKNTSVTPQFAEQGFEEQAKTIRRLLDQYRNRPDYYGPPWQLRRTFEPVHAERASQWFFSQGGKGALRSMGTRLQNILVASSIISVLTELYDDRLRTLILANSPERLGEWRRGLQDCLGISRGDFGPDQGLVLFEAPEALAVKAERTVKEGDLPFIIIDETEDKISLSVLQFPLWLAFAPDPQSPSYSSDRY